MPSTRCASGKPRPAARASTTDVAARLRETGSLAAMTSATKQAAVSRSSSASGVLIRALT